MDQVPTANNRHGSMNSLDQQQQDAQRGSMQSIPLHRSHSEPGGAMKAELSTAWPLGSVPLQQGLVEQAYAPQSRSMPQQQPLDGLPQRPVQHHATPDVRMMRSQSVSGSGLQAARLRAAATAAVQTSFPGHSGDSQSRTRQQAAARPEQQHQQQRPAQHPLLGGFMTGQQRSPGLQQQQAVLRGTSSSQSTLPPRMEPSVQTQRYAAWRQYQDARPPGRISLPELLNQPLWTVPLLGPLTPSAETSQWPAHPSSVVSLPEYFQQCMDVYRQFSLNHSQPCHNAPDYGDRGHAIWPENESQVIQMFDPALRVLSDIMWYNWGRPETYRGETSVGSARTAQHIDQHSASAGSSMQGLQSAAMMQAMQSVAAAVPSGELGTAPRNTPEAAAAAAPGASGAAAATSSQPGSRRVVDVLLRQQKFNEFGELCDSVPDVPGLPKLSTYLAQLRREAEEQQQQQQQPDLSQGLQQQQLQNGEVQEQWQQQQQPSDWSIGLQQQQQQYVWIPACDGRGILWIEAKKHDKLMDSDGKPLDLAELYPHCPSVVNIFGQGFCYFFGYEVCIGVLTCHEYWWIIERPSLDSTDLYISAPIHAAAEGPDQYTVLLAMAMAQHKAMLQLVDRVSGQLGDQQNAADMMDGDYRDDGTGGGDDSGQDDSPQNRGYDLCEPMRYRDPNCFYASQKEYDSDTEGSSRHHDQVPWLVQQQQQQSKLWQQKQKQEQQQEQKQQEQQQQLARPQFLLPVVPCTMLGLCRGAVVLGEGTTALVYKGSLCSRSLAVKVLYWQQRLMLHEVSMFNHAKSIQGSVIPELVGIGRFDSPDEDFTFIAFGEVEGQPLSSCDITPAIAAAAATALQRLHNCGIVHKDLTLDNMLLVQQPAGSSTDTAPQQQARVMLIDLGSARLASAQECQVEMQYLQDKLARHAAAAAAARYAVNPSGVSQ